MDKLAHHNPGARKGIEPTGAWTEVQAEPGGTGVRPCARCDQEPAVPGQRWGKKCRAAYNKKWRKQMVSVPREMLPVELRTARRRKAAKRLANAAPVNAWSTKREWERIDAND
jgi:hypothetical protein